MTLLLRRHRYQEEAGDDGAPGDGAALTVEQRLGQLEASNAELRTENVTLRGQIAHPPRAPEPPPVPKKVYTRAELEAAVDNREITEGRRDEILDAQVNDQAREAARQESQAIARNQVVADEMRAFQASSPDILDPSSETHREIGKAYQGLLALGDPDSPVTELKAYRQILRTPVVAERTQVSRPTTQTGASGAGGSPAPGRQPAGAGPPKDITPKQQYHYEQMIRMGQYTGWDDPKVISELAYRGKSRTRHTNPVPLSKQKARA